MMALFRREYRQIGGSMTENIAVGMNMDFCEEHEGDTQYSGLGEAKVRGKIGDIG